MAPAVAYGFDGAQEYVVPVKITATRSEPRTIRTRPKHVVFDTPHGPAYVVNKPTTYGIYSGKTGEYRGTNITLPYLSIQGK